MNGIAQKFITDQKGMTLIDMSIVLLVIGIMAAPMFQAYNIWKIQATRENTQGAQNTSAQAIDNYYFTNDFYPCPADPTLGPQDQGYGEPALDAAGNCALIDPATPTIATGALPFKALKIPPAATLDGYRNKLRYVVTLALTQAGTFQANQGMVKVMFNNDCDINTALVDARTQQPNPNPTDNYHFLMLSHGPNGRGAFNENGTLVMQCANTGTPGGPGGFSAEVENCNTNDTYVDHFCENVDVAGNSYFDDFVYEGYSQDFTVPTKIWDTASDPNNLGSKDLYLGIGTSTPAHELDVAGNIRATTKNPADPTDPNIGKAYAGVYCTDTGSGCFSAVAIAGNDPNMTCSSGKGMNGIAYAQAKCQNTISTSTLAPTNCPNGQYAKGVDAAGNIICGVP
jgi:type II secretory pathway pseudopilin PulG